MADEATLAAGTVVTYTNAITADPLVFESTIKGVISLGAVGEMAEAKESTVLADTVKKYGAGMKDAPDKTISFQHWALDAGQQAFIVDAIALKTIVVKVQYPTPVGGATGAIVEMEFKLLGFELDDVAGEDWMMGTVNAKQNSFLYTPAT